MPTPLESSLVWALGVRLTAGGRLFRRLAFRWLLWLPSTLLLCWWTEPAVALESDDNVGVLAGNEEGLWSKLEEARRG